MADCDNAGTLTRRCCNQREGDTPGPTELHTANAPGELRRRAAPASCDGELRRRAAPVSCDAASKGEHEEADPRRSVFFLRLRVRAGGRRSRGRFVFFFLDPTTRAAHIQRPGLDRPKLSAGAPAPISALYIYMRCEELGLVFLRVRAQLNLHGPLFFTWVRLYIPEQNIKQVGCSER